MPEFADDPLFPGSWTAPEPQGVGQLSNPSTNILTQDGTNPLGQALRREGADAVSVLREMLEFGDPRDLGSDQLGPVRELFERADGWGLWAFAYFICGLTKLTATLHWEMCAFLSKWGDPGWRRLMMMVPRGSFKTSLGSKALPLWLATRDPEVTIGIFNAAQDQAKDWIGSIRQILEASHLYHMLWPERLPPGIHFREREAGRTRPRTWKWGDNGVLLVRRSLAVSEPTFEPYGIGGSSTGRHYTHRVMDDLIGETSANSPALIEDAIHFVDHARALERPPNGGCEIVNCTPWAYRDTYSHMLTRWPNDYRVYRRSLLENPKTGEPDVVNGESIFPGSISTEEARKMHESDSFVFSCLPADAPVLMADWTERPISTLQAGDQVVGMDLDRKVRDGYRSRLITSVVEAVVVREKEVFEHDLSDGTQIRCSGDHQWWTGYTSERSKAQKRSLYSKIGLPSTSRVDPRQGFVVRLRQPLPSLESLSREQIFAAGYLSAIFDGEGHVTRDTQLVVASQCEVTNPGVCEAIRSALKTLGICWTEGKGGASKAGKVVNFYLAGVQERFKFWTWCRPSRKRDLILQSLWMLYGSEKPKIVASRSLGVMPVYAIQTSTHNYVAYLCGSSNSQYQCIPKASRETSFQREWIHPFTVQEQANGEVALRIHRDHFDPTRVHADVADERAPALVLLHWCDRAILLDPAPSKKNEKSQEPRARNGIVALALDPWGRVFTLEALPLREDPLTVMEAVVELALRWRCNKVGIEEVNFSAVYGPLWTALLKHRHPGLHLAFCPLKPRGEDKDTRIRGMVGLHRDGLWFYNPDLTGYAVQELLEYPSSETRDLIDAQAYWRQILSRPPTPDEQQQEWYAGRASGREQWTGY